MLMTSTNTNASFTSYFDATFSRNNHHTNLMPESRKLYGFYLVLGLGYHGRVAVKVVSISGVNFALKTHPKQF